MDVSLFPLTSLALAPAALMVVATLLARLIRFPESTHWRLLTGAAGVAFLFSLMSLALAPRGPVGEWLQSSTLGLVLAALVQLLGTVIGAFSARYLQGEPGQRGAIVALAAILTAVHLLLLADHWLVLIGAWAAIGLALQRLLCFYPDRPFARLAAHKKRLADRTADALLLLAAGLAWSEVGSGSLSALWAHITQQGLSPALHVGAVALVLAVVLRTALMPVHGWLIQVMEAPTPVSALLHAGVVNLGGFVLIRFAPLLEQAVVARALLLAFGLGTAILAGMVMLTRISIKVRLAWSTVAQMGFMLVECALGLYTLAALHLVGHSLYKAHAFLAASGAVRDTRLHSLHTRAEPTSLSLCLGPVLAVGAVLALTLTSGHAPWPWWWSVVLGLAWAPMLWWSAFAVGSVPPLQQLLQGLAMVIGLSLAALLAHALPLGTVDAPHDALGVIAMAGMAGLYVGLAVLHWRPESLTTWRRSSYAGFYLDETYTRLTLRLWPTRWVPQRRAIATADSQTELTDATR
ncbi:MAG: NADH-quinone oxidoreductase subunit L [Pseudomonadota bacterium]